MLQIIESPSHDFIESVKYLAVLCFTLVRHVDVIIHFVITRLARDVTQQTARHARHLPHATSLVDNH